MIGIINYGMGNLKSVSNALTFLKIEHKILNSNFDYKDIDSYILPGVGAFGMAIDNIKNSGLKDLLNEEILVNKKPILGLCLGMQLFYESSEENGFNEGLSWIEGSVNSFKQLNNGLTVPHMGWNNLTLIKDSALTNGLEDDNFYFVHSFYCKSTDNMNVVAQLDYGINVDVIVQKDNIFGCQFHPEKSQKSGLLILSNFSKI